MFLNNEYLLSYIAKGNIYVSLAYDGSRAKGIDEIIQECYNLKNDFKIIILLVLLNMDRFPKAKQPG